MTNLLKTVLIANRHFYIYSDKSIGTDDRHGKIFNFTLQQLKKESPGVTYMDIIFANDSTKNKDFISVVFPTEWKDSKYSQDLEEISKDDYEKIVKTLEKVIKNLEK